MVDSNTAPPTPPTLRRSCKACARGKRRCDQRWPRCSRCLARGTECEYVNIPLTNGYESTYSYQAFRRHVRLRPFIQRTPIQPSMRLEISKGYEHHIISFLVKGLQGLPLAFAENMRNLFIQPDVYETSGAINTLRDVRILCRLHTLARLGVNSEALSPILRRKVALFHRRVSNAADFYELLSSVQALLLLQCILLLNDNGSEVDQYSETTATTLTNVAEQLWERAPIQLPSTMSSRRAWLFAESVRRTIIVGFMLRSVYSLKTRNYSVRTPFVDSLPFDIRTSLWNEVSEEAWNRNSLNPSEYMVSLHQYSAMLENGQVHNISPFGSLILAACKGKSISEVVFPSASLYQAID
ncbi:hypothetical protein BDV59DRAFT_134085 [Aspergillus ambiguus]|uniref:Zn(II)2Cys6 transcription factor domain-containing protein n=1 Tax=Aspergillus ambiguus TaxID=176160 RepID=UPI003CCC950D